MELSNEIIQAIGLSLFICFFCDFMLLEGNIFGWYTELIERLPTWLYYPLGGCIYCFSVWAILAYLYLTNNLTLCTFVLYSGTAYAIIDYTHGKFTFGNRDTTD